MKMALGCICAGLVCSTLAAQPGPAIRAVKATGAAPALIPNGGFEEAAGAEARLWNRAPQGYVLASGEGRAGSQALRCENRSSSGWVGASQTITLSRTNAVPLVIRAWSKARDVSGGVDNDYSIYIDLLYADGTPLWGRTGNFRAGTHDWEQREVLIFPEKPIKQVTVHCLLRNHTGTVWFDDVHAEEVSAPGGAVLFQGVPVLVPGRGTAPAPGGSKTASTADGLQLALSGTEVNSLRISGKELSSEGPSGFLVRDAALGSDFFGFSSNSCQELGLGVKADLSTATDYVAIQGRVTDLTHKDRAITLVFALPLDAVGWTWGDDIRRSRDIAGTTEYAHTVAVQCGSTGTMSLYPLAALWQGGTGLAIAIDMAQPAQYRLAYNAGTKHLLIAFDFGLVADTRAFPSSADFRFVLYTFDGRWGFRAAFEKFMRIFPDQFLVRSKEQGLWMAFTDVSTVQGWEDFGFKYHEGNNNVPWDDAHNVLSFRYTEPMTWWMRMPPEVPRTISEAIRLRDALATGTNEHERRMAQVTHAAGMLDPFGQPPLIFRNEPWCNGAIWSLNPNPKLSLASDVERQAGDSTTALNAATVYWNPQIKEKLYGAAAKGQLDGEYLDSLEGYVTADLNFRRDHFRATTVPLTFASDTKAPALHKGLAVFEFTKWLSQDVHGLNKLMFANGVPYRFSFLCPWLDVLGTETDWLRAGKWSPAPDVQMSLWRTLSGSKPYLLLMNTDFNALGTNLVERYFQRSLFYGMFPGMFSHNASENPYWQNPAWYNRDRALFKKYIPLIRHIAEAGWQPITRARTDNEHILLERFGSRESGGTWITVLNDSDSPQSATVGFDPGLLPPDVTACRELISGTELQVKDGRFVVNLKAQEAALLWLAFRK